MISMILDDSRIANNFWTSFRRKKWRARENQQLIAIPVVRKEEVSFPNF
jgi:hypothetical protein